MAFRFAPRYHLQAGAQQAASITINYSRYNLHASHPDQAQRYSGCVYVFLSLLQISKSFFKPTDAQQRKNKLWLAGRVSSS